MKLINISINKYFHMIPLWKSPIKLPVELPVDLPVDFCRPLQRDATLIILVLEDYVNFPQTFRKTFGPISHVSDSKLSF